MKFRMAAREGKGGGGGGQMIESLPENTHPNMYVYALVLWPSSSAFTLKHTCRPFMVPAKLSLRL